MDRENQKFQKNWKNTWKNYHFTNINDSHMMHCSSDKECNGQNFGLSFWTVLCPFTPLTIQKIKILEKWKNFQEILSFYTCVPLMTSIYDVWFLRHGGWRTAFLVILDRFLSFYPANNPKNQNFEKWKKHLETLSFYKCVP